MVCELFVLTDAYMSISFQLFDSRNTVFSGSAKGKQPFDAAHGACIVVMVSPCLVYLFSLCRMHIMDMAL